MCVFGGAINIVDIVAREGITKWEILSQDMY